MARRLAVPLALLLLEDDHLLGAQLAQQGGLHRGAFDHRSSNRHVGIVPDQENVLENDLAARLCAGPHALNRDALTNFHAVLLPASFHNCVHEEPPPDQSGNEISSIARPDCQTQGPLCARRTKICTPFTSRAGGPSEATNVFHRRQPGGSRQGAIGYPPARRESSPQLTRMWVKPC